MHIDDSSDLRRSPMLAGLMAPSVLGVLDERVDVDSIAGLAPETNKGAGLPALNAVPQR